MCRRHRSLWPPKFVHSVRLFSKLTLKWYSDSGMHQTFLKKRAPNLRCGVHRAFSYTRHRPCWRRLKGVTRTAKMRSCERRSRLWPQPTLTKGLFLLLYHRFLLQKTAHNWLWQKKRYPGTFSIKKGERMKLEEIPASSEAEFVRVETESGIKVDF
jgi:hypothetical protein